MGSLVKLLERSENVGLFVTTGTLFSTHRSADGPAGPLSGNPEAIANPLASETLPPSEYQRACRFNFGISSLVPYTITSTRSWTPSISPMMVAFPGRNGWIKPLLSSRMTGSSSG